MPFRKPKESFNAGPSGEEVDAFVEAASRSSLEGVAGFLDKHAAAIDAKHSRSRWTALMTAAQCGRDTMVKKLLEEGATLDIKDGEGRTALMWAVMYGHKEASILLLEKGADINAKDKGGSTPLMLAAERGRKEVLQMLLERGADFEEKNVTGWDALVYAKTAAFGKAAEMVAVLEQWVETQKQQKHAQWMKDTDFSGGLKHPIRAAKPLKPKL